MRSTSGLWASTEGVQYLGEPQPELWGFANGGMDMNPLDESVIAVVREEVGESKLGCAQAFRIAERLKVAPLMVGRAADSLDVHLARCQLGLFGYRDKKRIVVPAETVEPELEQAIREGLVLGRLPCAVAWAIASRFGISKVAVANATEGLAIPIGQCQLGAF